MRIHSVRRDPNSSKPLEGLKIIDVGCAAGMLSEVLKFSILDQFLPDLSVHLWTVTCALSFCLIVWTNCMLIHGSLLLGWELQLPELMLLTKV